MSSVFSWADLPVVGNAFDICAAVVLASSLWGKTAWKIRQEIPRTIAVSVPYGGNAEAPFPQGLAKSLARQSAEARLGVRLLFVGFTIQALYYFFPHPGTLATWVERGMALLLAMTAPTVAFIGMKRYVPGTAQAIYEEVETGERRVWSLAERLVRHGVTLGQLRRGGGNPPED